MLSQAAGVPVSLKLESQQLTGSFKIRGAFFRLLSLSAGGAADRRRDLLGRQPRQGGRARRARARHSRDDLRPAQRRRIQVPGHPGARSRSRALRVRRLRRDRDPGARRREQEPPAVRVRVRRRADPGGQRRHARRRGPRGRSGRAQLPAAGRAAPASPEDSRSTRRKSSRRPGSSAASTRSPPRWRSLWKRARPSRGCRRSRRPPGGSREASGGPASRFSRAVSTRSRSSRKTISSTPCASCSPSIST